jgi:hypothetical protein
VRQVHREEVDLPLRAADHRQRFAEVDLRMSRFVPQRHEHLARPLAPLVHVVLYNCDPAGIAVLVPQPLEDPLRGMLLLGRLFLSSARIRSMIPTNGSSFGRAGGRPRRYPGGTENASIFATVRGSIPNRRAASRRLSLST